MKVAQTAKVAFCVTLTRTPQELICKTTGSLPQNGRVFTSNLNGAITPKNMAVALPVKAGSVLQLWCLLRLSRIQLPVQ